MGYTQTCTVEESFVCQSLWAMDGECQDESTCTSWIDLKGTLDLRCMIVSLGKMSRSCSPRSLWDNNYIKK